MAATISIITPENLQIEYNLAGISKRINAFLLDFFISFLISYFTSAIIITKSLINNSELFELIYVIVIYTSYLFVFFIYNLVSEWLWNGKTFGKSAFGIRVISLDGDRITLHTSILRNFLRFVDFLPLLYFLGIITFFITKNQQRIGDVIANTVVVEVDNE